MSLRNLVAGKTHTNRMEILLEGILKQLKTLNRKQGDEYYKEWYPMTFQFYAKGQYVKDPHFGTSKWGFKRLQNDPLRLNYNYEFDSLYLHTEECTYAKAIRLVINGMPYPEIERMASDYENYDDWQEFIGHNYCYERGFRFCVKKEQNTSYGYAEYPFKMTVKAPWTLNFDWFSTTTSDKWGYLIILGWKLHKIQSVELEELREL